MKKVKTANEFFNEKRERSDILNTLRKIVRSSGLEETIKWGIPTYTFNGKNILGIGAFKSYAGIWFFQGALLKDEHKVLVNAQEGKTKAMRQWRFTTQNEIDEKMILTYIEEAVENQKAGKEIKPSTKKPLIIPKALQEALDKDENLKFSFEKLNLTRRRDFAQYISSAKREVTISSRLEKIIPMIIEGIGLNDKYIKK